LGKFLREDEDSFLGLSEAHPDPFARLTYDSAMGNLLFGGRLKETPVTTSNERELTLMEENNVSSHEKEAVASYNGAQYGDGATRYIAGQPGASTRYIYTGFRKRFHKFWKNPN